LLRAAVPIYAGPLAPGGISPLAVVSGTCGGEFFPRDRERGNKPMFRTFYSSVTCAVLLSSLAAVSAQAAGGCGPGFHRGLLGVCVANGPAVIIAPVGPAVVVAPPVVAVAPAPVVVAAPAPAVVVAPAAVVVAPAVVCGRGFRWHPGFRRCVVL
jgi:hypothetical protein